MAWMDAKYFSLADDSWVPVTYLDGRDAVVSLRTALLDAHLIRGVSELPPSAGAGLAHFLPEVAALVAQECLDADWDEWAEDGFPAEYVASALARIEERLWLRHPETPFMQNPDISADSATIRATSLDVTAPKGETSGAWWGSVLDSRGPRPLAAEELVLLLISHWYFSMAGTGRGYGAYSSTAPHRNWLYRGGRRATEQKGGAALVVFAVGPSLSQTLLQNVQEEWLEGRPAWLSSDAPVPAEPSRLYQSSRSGTSYRIEWRDEDNLVETVFLAGQEILIPAEKPLADYKTDKVSSEEGLEKARKADFAKKLEKAKASEREAIAAADASVVSKADGRTVRLPDADALSVAGLVTAYAGVDVSARPSGLVPYTQLTFLAIGAAANAARMSQFFWLMTLPVSSRESRQLAAFAEPLVNLRKRFWVAAVTISDEQGKSKPIADALAKRFINASTPQIEVALQTALDGLRNGEDLTKVGEKFQADAQAAVFTAYEQVTRALSAPQERIFRGKKKLRLRRDEKGATVAS